jgi:hypothetical protein
MSLRRILGGVLLALPNTAIFITIAYESGVTVALIIHGIVLLVLGVVVLGMHLVLSS